MSKVEIKSHKSDVLKALDLNGLRALTVAGDEAVNFAVDNLKAQHVWKTGHLQGSIDKSVDEGEKCVVIGTPLEYAPYVEFGTGIYYDGGGRQSPWFYQDEEGQWHKTRGMEARPYLKPALDEHIPFYKKIMEEELKG